MFRRRNTAAEKGGGCPTLLAAREKSHVRVCAGESRCGRRATSASPGLGRGPRTADGTRGGAPALSRAQRAQPRVQRVEMRACAHEEEGWNRSRAPDVCYADVQLPESERRAPEAGATGKWMLAHRTRRRASPVQSHEVGWGPSGVLGTGPQQCLT